MADEKKRDLDTFLSKKPAPKVVYEDDPKLQDMDEIPVDGYLRGKKGVTQAQVVPTPAPVVEAPAAPMAPIKQGGTFVPPAPAPVQQAPEIPDYRGPSGPNVWERAMLGATPLLVGLLTGNELEGVQESSNQLVGNEAAAYGRDADFNKKLDDMKMKRAFATTKAGGVNAKTFEYQGSDQKPRLGRIINGEYYRDESTDPLVPPKAAAKDSWIPKKINTENGPREVVYNPVTGETKEIGEAYQQEQRRIVDVDFQGEATKAVANLNSGKLESYLGKVPAKPASAAESGKDARQLRQIRVGLLKDFTKDTSTFAKRRDSLEGMAKAAQLLNDGGPIGAGGLRLILARSVFGEKGPLSDGDVSRMSGDPSAQAVASRVYDKFLEGKPLTEADREDVRTVIDIAAKLAEEDANRFADDYINTYRAEGYDLTDQISQFRSLPKVPAFKKTKLPIRGATQAQSAPSAPKAGVVVGGYKFNGGDPKDKKNWTKE